MSLPAPAFVDAKRLPKSLCLSETEFDFLSPMCCICLEIMVDPSMIVECGHMMCTLCVHQIPDTKCPVCRTEFKYPSSVVLNLHASRLIGSLTFKCAYSESHDPDERTNSIGITTTAPVEQAMDAPPQAPLCEWEGPFVEYPRHIRGECEASPSFCTHCRMFFLRGRLSLHHLYCPEITRVCQHCSKSFKRDVYFDSHGPKCPDKKQTCVDCNMVTTQKDSLAHREFECDRRLVPCKMCGTSVHFCDRVSHNVVGCEMRLLPCSNCKRLIPKALTDIHIARECPETVIQCDSKNCDFVTQRKNMGQHQKECLLAVVPCVNFHKYGCNIWIQRGTVVQHDEAWTRSHLNILQQHISNRSLPLCNADVAATTGPPSTDLSSHLRPKCRVQIAWSDETQNTNGVNDNTTASSTWIEGTVLSIGSHTVDVEIHRRESVIVTVDLNNPAALRCPPPAPQGEEKGSSSVLAAAPRLEFSVSAPVLLPVHPQLERERSQEVWSSSSDDDGGGTDTGAFQSLIPLPRVENNRSTGLFNPTPIPSPTSVLPTFERSDLVVQDSRVVFHGDDGGHGYQYVNVSPSALDDQKDTTGGMRIPPLTISLPAQNNTLPLAVIDEL